MSSRLILGVAVLLVIGVTAAVQLPTWIMLLLGSLALAVLYIVARLRSRFDPLDPRFGSCIPPITKPRDE
jgi:4-hydroxybenzoate polyprenyltransferase